MQSKYFVRSGGRERGPFSSSELRSMIAAGQVSRDSEVSADRVAWRNAAALKGVTWPSQSRPAPEPPKQTTLEDLVAKFVADDQSPGVVRRMLQRVTDICTPHEEIRYIAVQRKPLFTLFPHSVVATSRRIIFFRAGLLGKTGFVDFIWRDLNDARIKEGILGATFVARKTSGETFMVSYLPKKQARAVYRICQEMEEFVREERRSRELEESRARAGGVQVHMGAGGAPATSGNGQDAVAALKRLKQMHEEGLLTVAEYEMKRRQIISGL